MWSEPTPRVVEMVDVDGKPAKQESVRTYDGKDRPIQGRADATEACEMLDASTSRCTQKRNGKVVMELLATLTPDGKTLLAQRTILSDTGKFSTGTVVYEKQ